MAPDPADVAAARRGALATRETEAAIERLRREVAFWRECYRVGRFDHAVRDSEGYEQSLRTADDAVEWRRQLFEMGEQERAARVAAGEEGNGQTQG